MTGTPGQKRARSTRALTIAVVLAVALGVAIIRATAHHGAPAGPGVTSMPPGPPSAARASLVSAAASGSLANVMQLLDRGADVNATDQAGCTPLMAACRAGHCDVARLLIARGADAGRPDAGGVSPLLAACGLHRGDLVEVLIEGGADVNSKDRRGNSPLTFSLATDADPALVNDLIAAGADLTLNGTDGRTPLVAAAAASRPLTLERLWNARPRPPPPEIRGALQAAMYFNKVENLKFLIGKGADVDARNADGLTLLAEFAGSEGRTQCMDALIEAGADVNAVVDHGQTALSIARARQQWKNVELLLKVGAVDRLPATRGAASR